QPKLFATKARHFIESPNLLEEVFGPAALLIECSDTDELLAVARHLNGQLTATLHLAEQDTALARELVPLLERRAGRILVNGFPTGVEVTYAMVHGVWNRALEVSLPNAAANPLALFYGFKGVACASAGNCALGGQFLAKTGHYQGFLDNVVNGTLQRAQALVLPAGAAQSGHNGGVVSISCPGVGTCVAGAAYLNAQNAYVALLTSETNDVWSAESTVSLPGTAATVGVAGGVYSVQCFNVTTCQVSGSYQSGATRYDGFSLVTGARAAPSTFSL